MNWNLGKKWVLENDGINQGLILSKIKSFIFYILEKVCVSKFGNNFFKLPEYSVYKLNMSKAT